MSTTQNNAGQEERQERLNIVQTSAREFLAGEWSPKQFRELIDTDKGYSDRLWTQMRELGWPATLLSEQQGGSDGDFVELATIMEQCGLALAPSPLVTHTVSSQLVLRSAAESLKREILPLAADGSAPVTLAVREAELVSDRRNVSLVAKSSGGGWLLDGEKRFVPSAGEASVIIVTARLEDGSLGLLAVPAKTEGVSIQRLKPMDWSAVDIVKFSNVKLGADRLVARGAEADKLLDDALIQNDVLVCAEVAGLANTAMNLANAYAKDRVAFGKPIGQFQAIKHRLVNMLSDLEIGRALIRTASADIASGDAKRRVSSAQAAFWCLDALKKIPESCVQVFGGIGFTWEHDLHLFLRRSTTLVSHMGDRVEYREIVAKTFEKAQ